jgi:hypothetical protein
MAIRLRRQNFQTISWFYDVYKRKLLNLDPPYQRRSVWNQLYREEFIDTILLQFPAPAIFLYEEISPDGLSTYNVVDGKQRLSAIFAFIGGDFPVSENSTVQMKGMYFEQFGRDEKTAFWTYEFSVEYLPTNEDALIESIFRRINKNTARLTPQELRHARFGGRFITVAEVLSESLMQLPEGFPRIESQSRKQMKDVELVANLLLSLEGGVRGFSQEDLDSAFSERETNWERESEIHGRFLATLGYLRSVVLLPSEAPLYKSRFRNQADFYSLFVAVDQIGFAGNFQGLAQDVAAQRLSDFVKVVEDEHLRDSDERAKSYFKAARSNSNDTGPRRLRVTIIEQILSGVPYDNTAAISSEI